MVNVLDTPRPFPGGLRLESHKAQSLRQPLRPAHLPQRLYVPLAQHIGEPAEPMVRIDARVLKGQLLGRSLSYISAPVHAPTSGRVIDIGEYRVPHPSGLKATCVVIAADGEDRAEYAGAPITELLQTVPAEIRRQIRQSGIVGLGGAGFPTAVKLNPGPDHEVELLLINAAECEPYISCDEALMCARPRDVIDGIRIMRHALLARQVVIGIEDNMPGAARCLQAALADAGESDIRVVSVPARYPAGGERQLIYALTGEEVPSQGLPIDIGVVCQNVGTAAAVARALRDGEPLISRVVTVAGAGVREPANLEVRIGTPIAELIEQCGGYSGSQARLLMGGPMMGVALPSDALPVIKTSNCFLVASEAEAPPPKPARACIRCGECVSVCPARLLPHQLYWHARTRDLDRIQEYDLFDCIECGCCAQVCPSHIPLVQYYRFAKTEIWEQERDRLKADVARQRHELRLERLEREKRELEARRAKAKQALKRPKAGNAEGKKAEIAAALERVKAKRAAREEVPRNVDNLTPEQEARVAATDKRRAERQRDA